MHNPAHSAADLTGGRIARDINQALTGNEAPLDAFANIDMIDTHKMSGAAAAFLSRRKANLWLRFRNMRYYIPNLSDSKNMRLIILEMICI